MTAKRSRDSRPQSSRGLTTRLTVGWPIVATDSDDLSAWYASAALHWPTSVTNLDAKIEVADRIAARVRDGALIGIGSGSATYMALWAIGRRVTARVALNPGRDGFV